VEVETVRRIGQAASWDREFADSLLEEAVRSEPVSEMGFFEMRDSEGFIGSLPAAKTPV
jgi:hypothetical protein